MIGVDYGSKTSGLTTLAYTNDNQKIIIEQCSRGKDADQWLLNRIQVLSKSVLALDAPLSLPGVYRNIPGCNNYHYRQCDLETKAMSPMFLGGLTARAMSLKAECSKFNVDCYEVYPKAVAQSLAFDPTRYKKDVLFLEVYTERICDAMNVECSTPANWHQFDALLAFYAGWKILNNTAEKRGVKSEGIIYF